jgi:hypothetical protein
VAWPLSPDPLCSCGDVPLPLLEESDELDESDELESDELESVELESVELESPEPVVPVDVSVVLSATEEVSAERAASPTAITPAMPAASSAPVMPVVRRSPCSRFIARPSRSLMTQPMCGTYFARPFAPAEHSL